MENICKGVKQLIKESQRHKSSNVLTWGFVWREMKEGEPFSPLGSLEAAAMKLSAAVCNLFTYSVSDGWSGGEGGGRQKYLAQNIPVNCML